MTLAEILCLTYLESLEGTTELQGTCGGCDVSGEALVEESDGRWHLTPKGRLHLANLRSLHRQHLREN